ncbi:hypothetical protein BU17DRAFT_36415, partial [Hysterangium stoloniferum]
ENLVDDGRYVTAWPIEGFTNQFIAQVNLLYLADLADRIPVLPSFVRSRHMMADENSGKLAFSEVFDLSKVVTRLQRPVLDWQEIKNVSSEKFEDIGCWSVWKTRFGNEPHFSVLSQAYPLHLSVDVSLTRVPDSVKLSLGPGRFIISVLSLASLGWPEVREEALRGVTTSPSPIHKHTMPPDEQMLCFDNLYYVGTNAEHEWDKIWSPSWNRIGKYIDFTPVIVNLTRSYVLKAFDLSPSDPFPLYIGIHARHGDFGLSCGDKHCFPPISTLAEQVTELQQVLSRDHGLVIDKVLITSDEKNQTWWDDVRAHGWKTMNHDIEQTAKLYGAWYPIILDSAALSFSKAFIGTAGSTVSLVARRRVEFWAKGPVRVLPLRSYR